MAVVDVRIESPDTDTVAVAVVMLPRSRGILRCRIAENVNRLQVHILSAISETVLLSIELFTDCFYVYRIRISK